MWQRFTERARTSVFWAQEEAGWLHDNQVSTGHLLLGLMHSEGVMEGSSALQLLGRLGIAPDAVRNEVLRILQPGDAPPNSDRSLTRAAKVSIDRAYDESRAMDCDHIGTEHLILGLISEEVGAGRVLVQLGADLDRARIVVCEMQGRSAGQLGETPSPSQ